MVEAGQIEPAEHMVEQLLHRPYENPDLFLWMVRAVREDKFGGLRIDVSSETIVQVVFETIDECQRRIDHEDPESSRLKGLKLRLQNLLAENHQALLVEAFEGLDLEETRRRHRAVMDNPTLSETFRLSFDSAVRRVCFNLDEADPGAATSEHLVTAEALEERQKEYQRIKNVEIPENSRAIGQAAAMGDLSENAEYESAKERQKILFRRLESLEDLLHRARAIEPDQVDASAIGFGTTFLVRDQDSARTEKYTLLGLWDADPERHILSYLTPFAKQFLKRRVGDTLLVNHPGGGSTRYEVLEITNALQKQ